MGYFFKLLFIISAVITLASCKKDPSIPVVAIPKTSTVNDSIWVLDSTVTLDRKILLASNSFGTQLYLLGNNYLVTIDSTTHTTSSTLVSASDIGVFSKPVLTPLFYSYLSSNDSTVVVGLNQFPNVSVSINVLDSDTNIHFICSNSTTGPLVAINDLNQLIIPVQLSANADNTPTYQAFAIYNINASIGSSSLSVSFKGVIQNLMDTVSAWQGHGHAEPPFVFVQAMDDNFYYSSVYQGITYKIDVSGNFTKLFNGELLNFVYVNDTLNALGSYSPLTGNYYSELQWFMNYPATNVWIEYNFNISPDYRTGYAVVQNKVIAYRLGQIWEVVINKSTSSVQFKELDNSTISTNYINSVIAFDNKVYVTTIDGLFYKPINKFFTYK